MFILLFLPLGLAIPIDNGILGEPEIECDATEILIYFNTRNEFKGHTYIKGFFNNPNCRNEERGRFVAGISLPFDRCGLVRARSLNPRGVTVSTTVVVSFHPQFVTKIDRAYHVQCFYMEATKDVDSDIDVADISINDVTAVVQMPVCTYQILDGSPSSPPIEFGSVGQQVYHKWTCSSDYDNVFCMLVHDCFVEDGAGKKVPILNENGCAIDRFVLNNLEYPTDLMAGQEAHIYKFADQSSVFFQCQITITIKEPGEECARPNCEEPAGLGVLPVAVPAPTTTTSTEVPESFAEFPVEGGGAQAPFLFGSSSEPSTVTTAGTTENSKTTTAPEFPVEGGGAQAPFLYLTGPPFRRSSGNRNNTEENNDTNSTIDSTLRILRKRRETGSLDGTTTWDVRAELTTVDILNGDSKSPTKELCISENRYGPFLLFIVTIFNLSVLIMSIVFVTRRKWL